MQYGAQLKAVSRGHLPFWLWLLGLAVAEAVTVYLQVMAGVICHGVLLVGTIILAGLATEEERSNLFMSLSLAPLVRILSLTMPLAAVPRIYWYLIIYTPLLAATMLVMRYSGLHPRDAGLVSRGWPVQAALGIFIGLVTGTLGYAMLRPLPLADSFTLQGVLLPALILVATTGLVEELIFRGVMQTFSCRVMGLWGTLYVSLAFVVLYLGNCSLPDLAFVFLVALLFSAIVKRTGSILGVALAHGTANTVLYCILPFVLS